MSTTLILINPWIYDFAAYDLWSKPLGLLSLAGMLRERGFSVHLIDCLDVHHPDMMTSSTLPRPVRRSYGTGKFWREKIPKPPPLEHIPRAYSRYGVSKDVFLKELQKVSAPSAILVTSLMTYWYPGVAEAIRLTRQIHPGAPVILGGIYARLCEEHALQKSGADVVFTGTTAPGDTSLTDLLDRLELSPEGGQSNKSPHPYPAFDLLNEPDYVCLSTSFGCPFRCRYCASPFLNPWFTQRAPETILNEIHFWHKAHGIRDFAFYDDALLVNAEARMGPVMETLAGLKLGLRFHTPNALHVREISSDIAELLYLSGFRTIRLGLETSDMDIHNRLDKKISAGEFEWAVRNLLGAGFKKKDIGAYILMGLPGQSVESVSKSLSFADLAGATPYLAEYSPIPHTSLWEKALKHSEYDLASEPLFHNNTLLPCWEPEKREGVPELKRMVRDIRQGGTKHLSS